MEKPTQLLARYIAAYAPYGLKLIDIRDNHEFELMGLYDDSFSIYSQSEQTRTVYFNNNDYPDIKPILRPLSDLMGTTIINQQHGVSFMIDLVNNQLEIEAMYGTQLMAIISDVELLYQNHFDVFGLIDAGMAVDINTISPC